MAREFTELFGRPAEVVADAPGRVNLIGEHTDYNGGYVLPAAIPQRTRVELSRRDDDLVSVYSADVRGGVLGYHLGDESRQQRWLDYVQGATWALRGSGHSLGGFDLRIASEVPLGGGLSSSAALGVALLRGLRALYSLALDDVALALLAHRAESEFVGAPVGVMDPFAASFADERAALFLDTRTLDFERVPLPPSLGLVVIFSGVQHQISGGDYRTRRAECERAAALLGVPQLRDVADERALAGLPAPLDRRARHVVREDARVLAAVRALRAGDLAGLGALFAESHASMRDDYEVSVPAIDALVEVARADPAVYGARLTGGGFGGSVVILAPRERAGEVAARVARRYAEETLHAPRILVPPIEGAGEMYTGAVARERS